MNDQPRPRVLVARAIFPEVIERLRQHFDVQINEHDEVWSSAQLSQHLQGKQGAFITAGEKIDAILRDHGNAFG